MGRSVECSSLRKYTITRRRTSHISLATLSLESALIGWSKSSLDRLPFPQSDRHPAVGKLHRIHLSPYGSIPENTLAVAGPNGIIAVRRTIVE